MVRHDALKPLSVTERPISHVSAITGTDRAFSVLIDKWVDLFGVVQALHQVFKWSATPVAIDGVDKLLPVPSRAVEVDRDDHVSISSQ